ncbi:hypothetical protein GCM10010497_04570 [Streptomyces cinereoruber]|uniref:Uncharacterized protein n=1 Tax=Streptomyces cinereoruber TaxID=67260 RepID=A0AAV4KAR4_9ACTN|nr:hypothetical protein GCM10010497_04570 [Streptomyces cinereoruber]
MVRRTAPPAVRSGAPGAEARSTRAPPGVREALPVTRYTEAPSTSGPEGAAGAAGGGAAVGEPDGFGRRRPWG